MTTAKRFPWAIECKRREGWSWKPLLAGKRSPVWGWWRQAQEAACELGLEPMLVFRRSREPWSIMLPRTQAWERRGITCRATWENGIEADHGSKYPVLGRFDDLLALHPGGFARGVDT